MKIIVRTLFGFEEILAAELKALGCEDIEVLNRAVSCEATEKQVMQANLQCRVALKVMVPILETYIRDDEELYDAVKGIEWDSIFDVNQTFATSAVVHSDFFRHSQYCSLKAKDAIADYFRDITGRRPFVNPVSADVNIVVHIRQNILTILLDSSGSSLHMRGYREYPVDAPLNEVLAAGILRLSEWDMKTPLIDPMCGSGTILIEAAMMAANMPVQMRNRSYSFMNWKDYDKRLWNEVQEEAFDNVNLLNIKEIYGYDKSLQSIAATNTNADEKQITKYITTKRQDFFGAAGAKEAFLITNPPYDQRLKEDDIMDFYKNIGDKLKKDYSNCTAWIFSGNKEALKNVGLKPNKKINLMNGDIEAGLYKFDLYEGSKDEGSKE
jgi:putative N6-adenine-specific DNA methylase